uniref:Uncharacterized protein n=1 Tax=Meloidogyne javanica TaxID=6303 RepID=A0A915LQC8_MELJA
MHDKAKLLLIFALILNTILNVGATPDSSDEDGVLTESRIKQLKQIVEIDNLTDKPCGVLSPKDLIKFNEYKYLKEDVKHKNLYETFKEAFERLVDKIVNFVKQNSNIISLSGYSVEDIAKEIKNYDEINEKNSEKTIEIVMIYLCQIICINKIFGIILTQTDFWGANPYGPDNWELGTLRDMTNLDTTLRDPPFGDKNN